MTQVETASARGRGRPRSDAPIGVDVLVLDAATDEFLGHGYAGASISRIVRTARISTKTIYVRYANKEELFMAVVGRLLEPTRMQFATLFEDHGDDVRGALLAVSLRTARHWTSELELSLYSLVISERVRFPELVQIYDASIEPVSDLTAAFLDRPETRAVLDVRDLRAAIGDLFALTTSALRDDALLGRTVTSEEIDGRVGKGVDAFMTLYGR